MWQKHDICAMKMTWMQEEKDDVCAFKKTFAADAMLAYTYTYICCIDDLSLTLIRQKNIHSKKC